MNGPAVGSEGVASLAAILESHYEELRGFATRRAGCPALGADIVQEAWLRATAATDIETIRDPLAYLYRMVRNLAVDRVRHERSHSRHIVDGAPTHDIAGTLPDPERIVASREELVLLQEAIAALPERCREVFLLYRGEGLAMREVARRLGITEKTVENQIAKAMLRCRQAMRAAGRSA